MNNSNLLEIQLFNSDDFLKIKETLTRIGIANNQTKTIYQTAYILSRHGKYYIVHFKEMFLLDGKFSSMSEDDYDRRDAIANLLQQWNLLKIVSPITNANFKQAMKTIRVIPFKDKANWRFISKYNIGHFAKNKN